MNNHELPDKEQLTEEAVYWITKLHSGNVTHSEKVKLSKWLNSSHRHLQAFDEMSATWTSLGNARYLPSIQEQTARLKIPTPENRLSRTLIYSIQAACLAILMCGGLIYYSSKQASPRSVAAPIPAITQLHYETPAGKDLVVSLPDGSQVHLNTKTAINVKYSQAKRFITLLRGEAHFTVASNKTRPFVVQLGESSVTAVGTAFNIHRQANQSTVTITEGIVSIRGECDSSAEAMRVPANRKVKLIDNSIHSIEGTSTKDEIAWQAKQLVFRSEPLDLVFKELNRYLVDTIIIQDPTIKSLRLTGTFDVSKPEKVVFALKESYGLTESVQKGYRFIRRHKI